jgi:hypothetical protein
MFRGHVGVCSLDDRLAASQLDILRGDGESATKPRSKLPSPYDGVAGSASIVSSSGVSFGRIVRQH